MTVLHVSGPTKANGMCSAKVARSCVEITPEAEVRSVARSKVTHLLSEATDPMPRFNRSTCSSQTTRLVNATRPLGRIALSEASTTFAANANTAITPHTNEQAAPYSPFEPGKSESTNGASR